MEDVQDASSSVPGQGTNAVLDVGPDESPKSDPVVRREPTVIGGGRGVQNAFNSPAANAGPTDWSSVKRNDPCPCGSGKKFKKCHGVNA